jgi:hypothetical protein
VREFSRAAEFHHPEVALVGEDEPAFVVEIKDGVRVLRQRGFERQEQKSSRHAQMRDQHQPAFQLEQHVLAAPRDALDATPAQASREHGGRRLRRKPRAQKFGCHDTTRADETIERACDEFDFGKLRHKKRC